MYQALTWGLITLKGAHQHRGIYLYCLATLNIVVCSMFLSTIHALTFVNICTVSKELLIVFAVRVLPQASEDPTEIAWEE